MCDKKGWPSARAARRASHKVGNSFRVYLCGDCHRHHITKQRYRKGRT